uniref:Ribosomal protein L32 n=1 Tax=Romanomermis culicivorax TaxID=13658 RepID=A0A915K6Y8_ROMCU
MKVQITAPKYKCFLAARLYQYKWGSTKKGSKSKFSGANHRTSYFSTQKLKKFNFKSQELTRAPLSHKYSTISTVPKAEAQLSNV